MIDVGALVISIVVVISMIGSAVGVYNWARYRP